MITGSFATRGAPSEIAPSSMPSCVCRVLIVAPPPSWGEDGFAKIRMGSKNLGVEAPLPAPPCPPPPPPAVHPPLSPSPSLCSPLCRTAAPGPRPPRSPPWPPPPPQSPWPLLHPSLPGPTTTTPAASLAASLRGSRAIARSTSMWCRRCPGSRMPRCASPLPHCLAASLPPSPRTPVSLSGGAMAGGSPS